MDSGVPIEHLLAHSRWLRSLALRLVGDVHAADDLVQATWQAALESGPRHAENVRGWLGRVVRRTATAERRRQQRRERRERQTTTAPADPAASELVEQAELQRRLVALVTGLPEPGRSTVLLHFFKGMSPSAIARRHGLPASTVRNRLKRALDALRDRLDDEHEGDRRRWLVALVPLAVDAHVAQVATGTTRVVLAAAAAATLAVGGFWWTSTLPPPADAVAEASTPVDAPTDAPGAAAGSRAGDDTARGPAIERVAVPTPPGQAWGIVVDEHGRAVAGVDVEFRAFDDSPATLLGASDDDGVFWLPAALRHGNADVRSGAWVTVLRGRRDRAAEGMPPTIVVAPGRPVTGRVTSAGNPVPGAVVQLTIPPALRARVGVVLDAAEDRTWQALSGPDGSFAIADAPDVDGLAATCRAVGYGEWHGAVARPLDVQLTAFADGAARTIRGRVEAADGTAVEGARVSLAGRDTTTGADGGFELPVAEPLPANARLVAIADDHGFAFIEDPDRWSSFAILRLPERAVYAGVVRDRDGMPVAGAMVQLLPAIASLADPTVARVDRVTVAPTERLQVGPALRLASVTTDERGAFRIDAPEFAAARLTAVDMHSLRAAHAEITGQRRDIELVFADDRLRTVRGAVVDQWREPIAAAHVSARLPMPAQSIGAASIALGSRATTTDEAGRFAFDALTAGEIDLFASVPGAAPTSATVGANRDDVVITVVRCGHVRVLAAADAEHAVFLDGAGEPVPVVACEGRLVRRLPHEVALFEGRSSVLRVPLHVVSVAVYAGGLELAHTPIRIAPDRLNVVRP